MRWGWIAFDVGVLTAITWAVIISPPIIWTALAATPWYFAFGRFLYLDIRDAARARQDRLS